MNATALPFDLIILDCDGVLVDSEFIACRAVAGLIAHYEPQAPVEELVEQLVGTPDLHIRADSRTWVGFLRKERGLVWALLCRRIVLKGSPRLLLAFGKCFPS